MSLPTAQDSAATTVLRHAAAYVRMSTDYQRYSIENQLQVIEDYALLRGIRLIRTYSDGGRSGLTLQRRDAMLQLLSDVTGRRADFDLILIYDVSRWGRFQDIDESAHYEFICRRSGVQVEYCADGFQNDGSIVSTLMKGVKRAMAAELSREFSEKVLRGQTRLARLGFLQGGTPGFGLRRMLVDRDGRSKGMLRNGQKKSIHDDRVKLVPGPEKEREIVREIFRLYVEERLTPERIANILNQRGIRNGRGNRWQTETVRLLLRNERYIGVDYYNRRTQKLQCKSVAQPTHRWIRVAGLFAPIVDRELFALAQSRLNEGREISDADLFNHLTAVWCVAGRISCTNMAAIAQTPVPNTYTDRFGSLENAYRLLGYRQTRAYRYAGLGAHLCRIDRDIICQLTASVLRGRGTVKVIPKKNILEIDGRTTVAAVVLPYAVRNNRRKGWRLQFDYVAKCDLLMIVRMTVSNTQPLDYHLVPFPLIATKEFWFTEERIAALANYRLDSPAEFYDACRVLQAIVKTGM